MSLNFKTSGAPHSTPLSRVSRLHLQHCQQGPVAGLQGKLAAPGNGDSTPAVLICSMEHFCVSGAFFAAR